jgi:hypothetical protein
MYRRKASLWLGAAAVAPWMAIAPAPSATGAEEEQAEEKPIEGIVDRLGGHVGIALPLVVFQGDDATSLGDEFSIGIPFGVGVKIRPDLIFDMELVPFITDGRTNLVVHPGMIYNFYGAWAAGLRFAVETNGDSWGFTPLLNRNLFEIAEGVNLFAELDIPIRIVKDQDTAVAIATHFGVGF